MGQHTGRCHRFPLGPVTLLSGTTVPLAGGIVRLLLAGAVTWARFITADITS